MALGLGDSSVWVPVSAHLHSWPGLVRLGPGPLDSWSCLLEHLWSGVSLVLLPAFLSLPAPLLQMRVRSPWTLGE